MISKDEHIDGRREPRRLIPGFRSRLVQSLDEIATFLEAHRWAIFAIITGLYLIFLAFYATARRLWHDELITYYIAQAPGFGQMLEQTRRIDLNPPLYYIAARLAFKLLRPSAFSVRLPSMASFLLAGFCLYFFVQRRLSPIYGLLAALVLLGSVYKGYAFEARPYALVLAFLGVAALGWQRAAGEAQRSRRLGLLFLLLGGFGMLLSHVLAAIAYGGFFLGELVRLRIRRRPDWPLWITLSLPLATGILYLPLARNHRAETFAPAFQASLLTLAYSYAELWTGLATLLAAAVIAIVLVGSHRVPPSGKEEAGRQEPGTEEPSGFTAAENSFAIYLLFVPAMITALFMRSHSAYFSRYGMPAIFGAGILAPWFIASLTGTKTGTGTEAGRVAGLLAAVVFALGAVPPAAFMTFPQALIRAPGINNPDLTGSSSSPLEKIEPGLPWVDASGLTFLEMDNREGSAFLSRVYYLTDRQAAMQYSHATIFEGLGALKHIFPIRANVIPYQQFVRRHPKFLVYGTVNYPEDWLLRKLLAVGATLRYLGDFPENYKDSILYEVTLPQP